MKNEYGTFVKKTGQEYKIAWDNLPEKSQEYLIQRGLDHCQDCHAGIHGKVTKDGELVYPTAEDVSNAAHEAIAKKIKALNAGIISIRSTGLVPIDPVEKIAYGLAKKDIADALAKQNIGIKTVDKMKLHELTMEAMENENLDYMTRAKVILDAKDTTNSTSIDVSSIIPT
ncbi:MAG: hypothetical protein KAJ19_26925 [Gammaproteobacteria bacterium]|nr:hypothetical protein [Gammaproteobacteria bacterium]